MIYQNVGAGLGGWENTVNPYAQQLVPDAKKTTMAAFGLPELDSIEAPELKSPDLLDVEAPEYQSYMDTGKWLQQQAIKARQAGIDVTKPGFDPLAQQTSQEWMGRYADWLDKGRQLNQSYLNKKIALTGQQGANTISTPFGSEMMSQSDVQNYNLKADEWIAPIDKITGAFKDKLYYGARTLDERVKEYDNAVAQLDNYVNSVPENIREYIKQKAELQKAAMREPLRDEWKYTQEGLQRQRLAQGEAHFQQTQKRLASAAASVDNSPQALSSYNQWIKDLSENKQEARRHLYGLEIDVVDDFTGDKVTKTVGDVEVVNGNLVYKDGYGKVIETVVLDPQGSIKGDYGTLMKSKGLYGYVPEKKSTEKTVQPNIEDGKKDEFEQFKRK